MSRSTKSEAATKPMELTPISITQRSFGGLLNTATNFINKTQNAVSNASNKINQGKDLLQNGVQNAVSEASDKISQGKDMIENAVNGTKNTFDGINEKFEMASNITGQIIANSKQIIRDNAGTQVEGAKSGSHRPELYSYFFALFWPLHIYLALL